MIEGLNFEVEGGFGDDGTTVKAFLRLEGDFVEQCKRYLATYASTMAFEISRNDAEKLANQIKEQI